MTKEVSLGACRGVRRGECLTSRFGARCGESRYNRAFTLIELVVVSTIILILTGLVLSTAGYARKKGARARAETEIAAMSAACESYKADNGVYPSSSGTTGTDGLNPTTTDVGDYQMPCRYVYGQLSGDRDFDGTPDAGTRSYITFKPNSLLRAD